MNRGVWLDRSEAESTTLHSLLDRYETEIIPALKGAIREKSVLHLWRQTSLAVRIVATIEVEILRGNGTAGSTTVWPLRPSCGASLDFRTSSTSTRREWQMEILSIPVDLCKPTVANARTRRVGADAPNRRRDDRTANELELVIAASESHLLPTVITLAVETAMRPSEIAAFRWEHIALDRRVAYLPETKNGNSREVPLSQVAVHSLAAPPPGKSAAGRRKMPAVPSALNGPVLTVHPDGIPQAFEQALRRDRTAYEDQCKASMTRPLPAFLRDLRFHDLRHEATSRLASKSQLHKLAKITGRRDTRMLLRYYHPDVGELAKRLG
ncbi:site-specific integrase [Dyella japonica]|uniref:site-specific integrase n=1 Tax=Dyella japonica TaxID=231455 RepID=UPI001FCE1DD1|nr:site-specific integrase [Dyella japonica]